MGLVLFFPTLRGRPLLQAEDLWANPVYAAKRPPGALPRVGDLSGALVDYPADWLAAHELRHGRLPLWNPTAGLGQPLLAEWHTAPLSPLKLPFDLAPSARTYDLYLALRVMLAAVGAFLLARRRDVARPGATLAAVLYGLSGAVMSRFGLPTEGAAHALAPFLVLALSYAASGRRLGLTIGALITGLVVISAHPDLVALTLVGALWAVTVDLLPAAGVPRRRAVGRAVASAALGIALGAIQIVPFLAYLRSGHSYKFTPAEMGFFLGERAHLRATLGLLLYVGVPGTILAAAGAFTPRAGGARGFAAGCWILFFLLVGATLLLPPPWSNLVPARYAAFLAALALALLAPHGVELALSWQHDGRVLLIAAAAAAAWLLLVRGLAGTTFAGIAGVEIRGAAALAGTIAVITVARRTARPANVVGGAVALLVALELIPLGRILIYPGADLPALRLEASPAIQAALRSTPEDRRIVGIGAGRLEEAALSPNLAGLFGLADVRAVAAIFPGRYHALLAKMTGVHSYPTVKLFADAESPLLRLLGVGTIIAPASAPEPPGARTVYRDSACSVLVLPGALPRAFLAGQVAPVSSEEEALSRVAAAPDDVGTGRIAVAEMSGGVMPAIDDGAVLPAASSTPDAENIVIDATAPRHAMLVVTSLPVPGWRALVDGRRAGIFPVDVGASGIALPPGTHRVWLSYRPFSVLAGEAISLAALLALALGAAIPWIRLRRANRDAAA